MRQKAINKDKKRNNMFLKKRIFPIITIMIFSLLFVNLQGKMEKIKINTNKTELQFENVFVKSMKFHKKNFVKVEYDKKHNLETSYNDNILSFFSSEKMEVKIFLPNRVDFVYYLNDQGLCNFGKNYVIIDIYDGEYIEFKENEMTILANDRTENIKINSDGIYVEKDDERVNISSQGIVIESEDEDEDLTNFWGKLLGFTIKEIASKAVEIASKNPGKIVKDLVNEKDKSSINSDMFNIDIGRKNSYGINFDIGDGEKYSEEVNLVYSGKRDLTLNVENFNGKIEIDPWEEDFVKVNATISSNKNKSELEKIEISVVGSKSGDICNVKTIKQKEKVKASVKYKIKIPQDARVGEIISSNGNIILGKVNGNVNAITSNGSIIIDDMKGNVTLKTSNGKIDVENLNGEIRARTSNGKIILTEISGIVKARTSNSKILLYDVKEISDITTSNGSIYAEINELNTNADISTSNGSIKIFLSANIDAEIQANTSNARITTGDLEFSKQKMTNNYFMGVTGKGKNTLNIETSNGSIELDILETKL